MHDYDDDTPDSLLAARFRGYLPVVVDIECGGFNAKTDAILEISAVILGMSEKSILEVEQTYFHRVIPFAGSNVEDAALKFTGIDPWHPMRIARGEKDVFNDLFRVIRTAMKANGCTRLLVLPAYPQYCAATTASVYDMVFDWGLKTRTLPELRFVNHYHDEPTYIEALRASVQKHWMAHGRPDKLVMSFHGMPDRTLHLGDPYHCECHKTGRLLAEALGLQKDDYKVTFQSRFGRAKWLEPYTEPSLVAMAREGVGRVDVICPGFSSDCIETLEEIDQEAREAFLHAGGKAFHYIPCLNDSAEGMRALTAVCEQHLSGWPTRVAPAADELQRARAVGMGASL
jgi:hypothetical protein